LENTEEYCEKILKIGKKDMSNRDNIWKIGKKSKMKCEMI